MEASSPRHVSLGRAILSPRHSQPSQGNTASTSPTPRATKAFGAMLEHASTGALPRRNFNVPDESGGSTSQRALKLHSHPSQRHSKIAAAELLDDEEVTVSETGALLVRRAGSVGKGMNTATAAPAADPQTQSASSSSASSILSRGLSRLLPGKSPRASANPSLHSVLGSSGVLEDREDDGGANARLLRHNTECNRATNAAASVLALSTGRHRESPSATSTPSPRGTSSSRQSSLRKNSSASTTPNAAQAAAHVSTVSFVMSPKGERLPNWQKDAPSVGSTTAAVHFVVSPKGGPANTTHLSPSPGSGRQSSLPRESVPFVVPSSTADHVTVTVGPNGDATFSIETLRSDEENRVQEVAFHEDTELETVWEDPDTEQDGDGVTDGLERNGHSTDSSSGKPIQDTKPVQDINKPQYERRHSRESLVLPKTLSTGSSNCSLVTPTTIRAEQSRDEAADNTSSLGADINASESPDTVFETSKTPKRLSLAAVTSPRAGSKTRTLQEFRNKMATRTPPTSSHPGRVSYRGNQYIYVDKGIDLSGIKSALNDAIRKLKHGDEYAESGACENDATAEVE